MEARYSRTDLSIGKNIIEVLQSMKVLLVELNGVYSHINFIAGD